MEILIQHEDLAKKTFRLKVGYSYYLLDRELAQRIVRYKNIVTSDRFLKLEDAMTWLREIENTRLSLVVDTYKSGLVFDGFEEVSVKVIFDTTPMIGNGLLPDWIRTKKTILSVDTFEDNLCVFRCVALGQQQADFEAGIRTTLPTPARCCALAKKLANKFFAVKRREKLSEKARKLVLEDYDRIQELCNIRIRAYEVELVKNEIQCSLVRRPPGGWGYSYI